MVTIEVFANVPPEKYLMENNCACTAFLAGWVRDIMPAKMKTHQILVSDENHPEKSAVKLDSIAHFFFDISLTGFVQQSASFSWHCAKRSLNYAVLFVIRLNFFSVSSSL